ncbi:MAG: hypothetical protein A2268_14185 [Candidatus Raymondbacteria bacterium RifOxyA12_full_50_37]|uniref:Uncharacterized protein n=1 Tax=Candidatus Raymondbacteria bacterium RIFOXYD12_FULL_49_13 TaxID=1817890 RepID=A0A1F7FKX2_UNCRA|nr:MAG: hypothetical protein A2268_14185 [Candidatus Raymondbacteria bacterium RifOxyA12_full_50_37]OGJ86908.1 MAG: hypothetical protein A2350_02095 [Candidatus Raymondbacteria bacterium RifOxyB12_full_50_8]OGJ88228.1 MAG: hypothetical protein A2248_19525 [Candidatus Raymondbacteria bacterium RIFOXYA2_FULL_49_16]OGJ97095.1 MAG: hypothetical protein A2487_05835 [Candidatus Raymondbacteria bacterium RifOxyC12_full_50_8]OGK07273.1 MAG: hypothetical protein A2519_14195 [Candidatus Raymondbacteria b
MKYIIPVLCVAAVTLFYCSKSPVNPEQSAAQGTKRISINSNQLFSGHASVIPEMRQFDSLKALFSKTPDTTPSARKAQALINFSEAKVIVFRYDYDYFHTAAWYTPCDFTRATVEAFQGVDPTNWDEVIGAIRQVCVGSIMDVVYTGDMAKDGNYVTGNVEVRPGANLVVVGFIQDNKLIWTQQREYYYFPDEWKDMMEPYCHGDCVLDGWMYDWSDEQYITRQVTDMYNPMTPSFPPFDTYQFPGVFGPFKTNMTQAFSDAVCSGLAFIWF